MIFCRQVFVNRTRYRSLDGGYTGRKHQDDGRNDGIHSILWEELHPIYPLAASLC